MVVEGEEALSVEIKFWFEFVLVITEVYQGFCILCCLSLSYLPARLREFYSHRYIGTITAMKTHINAVVFENLE